MSRMLECDGNPGSEGSGYMLFRTLKSLLMLVPQSTCYRILRDRLVSISRCRQSALEEATVKEEDTLRKVSKSFVSRVLEVRKLHCDARWEAIRAPTLWRRQNALIITILSKTVKADGNGCGLGIQQRKRKMPQEPGIKWRSVVFLPSCRSKKSGMT